MQQANNKKLERTHDRRNGTTKSRKNKNTKRKGNVQILGILEVDNIKQMDMKENLKKSL